MAEQPNKEQKEGVGAVPSAIKKRKTGLILIGGLFLFILAGLGTIFVFFPSFLPPGINPQKKEETSQDDPKTAVAKQGHLYSLDSMVVNLADTDFPRYLKIKIEMESEEPKENEEFIRRSTQLKDAILVLLTSKTYADISDSTGKNRLKEEMILKANEIFEKFKVKAVYFTELVVQ